MRCLHVTVVSEPVAMRRQCKAPAWVRGLCQRHYKLEWRASRLGEYPLLGEEQARRRNEARRSGRQTRLCARSGCWRLADRRGLCALHYKEEAAAGTLPPSRKTVGLKPSARHPREECRNCHRLEVVSRSGYCARCRKHRRTHGRWPAQKAPREKVGAHRCSVPGCGRQVTARGLCASHYERRRRGSELATPVDPTRGRKLSQEQVAEARRLRDGGLSYAKLAQRFGVGLETMWRALNRRP